ncbi:MAG: hypothetical protein R3223_06380 [Longimicrobiales bacterium]|nr:hypothetical protein [Longimicrobiales bacterium]
MEIFEYVSVLTSIILGLGITHLLKGLAGLIQHPGREEIYGTHLAWVAYMLFTTVLWWWWQFGLETRPSWTLGIYLFVSGFALVFYLLCALLFPADMEDFEGYHDYFMSRKSWFLGLLAFAYVLDLLDTLLKGWDRFQSLGIGYPLQAGVIMALCFIGARTSSRRYHAVLVMVVLASQAYQAIAYLWTVA